MTSKQARQERLLPGGVPRWVRCYDDGGAGDRYTVVYTGRAAGKAGYPYLGMSGAPFHPQGVGQHGESYYGPVDTLDGAWPPAMGRKNHLGTRIPWAALPQDCQRLVLRDYLELWDLPKAAVPALVEG